MTNIGALPAALCEHGLFCLWRPPSKVPYSPHGGTAKTNDVATFAPFEVAVPMLSETTSLGLGVFGNICAIDIDHCIDDEGQYSEMALDIIDLMDSYTEVSPSGTGIHIYFTATSFDYDKEQYYINNPKRGLEAYVAGATKKYLTVTGNVVEPVRGLEERGDALMAVLEKYMLRENVHSIQSTTTTPMVLSDDEVIQKAQSSQNGFMFSALWHGDCSRYDSQSEADLALCNMLAFWCGKDAAQMDRLFRKSGLMRDKWNRPQSGSTYGAITIDKAIAGCRNVYSPREILHTATSIPSGMLSQLNPIANPRYSWDDIGNGNLFADVYKDTARFVQDRGIWFVYDGKQWQADNRGLMAMELCKHLANELMYYAVNHSDERTRNSYIEHVKLWLRRTRRETILKDASGVHPIKFSAFDRNPILLNCLNGTLNLATGEFYEHNAGDMLTKIAGVNYDPAAKSKRWIRFMDEVMQNKTENIQFLQKALGYALTGSTEHDCFFILHGPTSRNGKGTTMETFAQMMGDYAKAARPDTIAQKKSGSSGPSEDIARLAGTRFVNISEPDKQLSINSALLKTLTGGDTITARFLHENSFQYKQQSKFFINTNYLPTVSDMTLFDSDRVKVIPFDRHFEEHERDHGLKAELSKAENLSGILNWCIDGLRLIEETGFDAPKGVLDATTGYRDANDKIGQFVDDEMFESHGAEVRTDDVYRRYKVWCDLNGCYPESKAKFKTALETRMTIKRKRPSGADRNANAQTFIIGYQLRFGTAASIQNDEAVPTSTTPQKAVTSKASEPVSLQFGDRKSDKAHIGYNIDVF